MRLVDEEKKSMLYMNPQPGIKSLKKKRIKKRIYNNRKVATADVSDYIESFYNRTRRHQHLGGVSPEAFEAATRAK